MVVAVVVGTPPGPVGGAVAAGTTTSELILFDVFFVELFIVDDDVSGTISWELLGEDLLVLIILVPVPPRVLIFSVDVDDDVVIILFVGLIIFFPPPPFVSELPPPVEETPPSPAAMVSIVLMVRVSTATAGVQQSLALREPRLLNFLSQTFSELILIVNIFELSSKLGQWWSYINIFV